MRRVAALYVQTGGCYFDVPGVDPWNDARDARAYPGPHPVVAHPPCERWGKLAYVVQAKHGKRVGDDGGCFVSALESVRKWGGVLEHPEGSAAWDAFGLIHPPGSGGWVAAGDFVGWVCRVEQGHYGHRARKGTWLYAVDVELPSLAWGPSGASMRLDWMDGKSRERSATPLPFRDLLLSIARTARRRR
jgi:hypothetical protein